MRNLLRNTSAFEYYPNTGLTSDLNKDGDHTGDPQPVYGTSVTYRGTFSTPSGQTKPTFYGRDIQYTHVLVMCDVNADIDEGGYILWKGDKYEVRAVAPSLNVLSIALKRMTVDEVQIPDPEEDEEEDETDEEEDTDGEEE